MAKAVIPYEIEKLEQALYSIGQQIQHNRRNWQDAWERCENARDDRERRKYCGLVEDYEQEYDYLRAEQARTQSAIREEASRQLANLQALMVQWIKKREDIMDSLDRPVDELTLEEIFEVYSSSN